MAPSAAFAFGPVLTSEPRRQDRQRRWPDFDLDLELRRLSRQEARDRRALGRLTGDFLRARAYHALGFARLGDYSRERLGLSAREMQSAAQVEGALVRLPETARALECGEISWTHARLLAAEAVAENEERWLALARGRTARALESLLRQTRERRENHATGGGCGAGAGGDRAGGADGRAGADTAGAHELGSSTPASVRRGVGIDDDPSDDDAAIEGERAVRLRVHCPRRLCSRWRWAVELARRMAGEQLPIWQAAEAIAAEGLSAGSASAQYAHSPMSREAGERAVATDEAASPTVDECRHVDTADDVIHSCEPSLGGETADGSDTPVLARPAETSVDSRLLLRHERIDDEDAAPDPFVLDAQLRAVVRVMAQIDWRTGRLLRLLVDRNLHRAMGFDTVEDYVRERLAISPRKARALLTLERQTRRAPSLIDAYARGKLSWFRALTIIPVARGTAAAAWVERAQQVTVRRLVDEVQWACDVRDAIEGAIAEVAPPPRGARLTRTERQIGAHRSRETADAQIGFRGPVSVVALMRASIAAFSKPGDPGWRGLEALLEHAIAEWERQPRSRDPIFPRDGWRCAVPACSSRKNLHDHHIRFRSRGGDNARDNRVTVCAWHHLRGIHAGRVRAWGRAPAAIQWELGVRQGGEPLLRLVGDYYVNAGG